MKGQKEVDGHSKKTKGKDWVNTSLEGGEKGGGGTVRKTP